MHLENVTPYPQKEKVFVGPIGITDNDLETTWTLLGHHFGELRKPEIHLETAWTALGYQLGNICQHYSLHSALSYWLHYTLHHAELTEYAEYAFYADYAYYAEHAEYEQYTESVHH